MPWVKNEDCIGCGICVDKCPVECISLSDGVAAIDMSRCIHCGVCHIVCPKHAVRHDSERIMVEVEANIVKTKKFMEACFQFFGGEEEKQKCLDRMMRHFNKEEMVAQKTLEELKKLKLKD